MPNEPGANIVEELTKPETPVETPPVQAAPSPEPAAPEGTPSQETPAPSPQSEPPKPEGKTPEQVEQDRKFFQQKYQETKAKLDAFEKTVLPFDDKPETNPAPQAQPQAQPVKQPNRFEGMSQEQMDSWVAEHPTEAILAVVGQALAQSKAETIAAIEDRDKRREADAAQKYEKEYVNRVLDDFVTTNKVDEAERNEAVAYVQSLGVPLPPRAMGKLFIDRVNHQRSIANVVHLAQETQVRVAQQTRQQLLATQPDNGTLALSGDKPINERIAAKFGPQKEKGIVSELIG